MSAEIAHTEMVVPQRSFRNARLAAYWSALVLASILVFLVRRHALIGLFSIAVAVYGTQAAISAWTGMAIRDGHVDAPRAVTPAIPILLLGRMRIPIGMIKDATALGRSASFEAVGLATPDGAVTILFPDRQHKLDFFQSIRTSKPDIKIYRAS